MQRVFGAIALAIGLLVLFTIALQVCEAQIVPLGRHCGDVGPLPLDDPDFCGCTWGEVYFRGQSVSGALISLSYGNKVVTTTTQFSTPGEKPYYDLTAHLLGARRADILTMTVQFAGNMITRTFRAWPQVNGEQHIALAFPEMGTWAPWITGGYTRALALQGDVVWAGGPSGLISMNLTSGFSKVHTLPWVNQTVRALATSPGTMNNDPLHIWVIGESGAAELKQGTWHTHTIPTTGTPRVLTVDKITNAIWLGGGDGNEGYLAVYTGNWQVAGTFPAPVTAVVVDESGQVWGGTWGAGVYRQDLDSNWVQYRTADGLASNNVLAASAAKDVVWFGTAPYLSAQGMRGGISQFDMVMESWKTYTTVHGLPSDELLPHAPAPIHALAISDDDSPWAGTPDGVRFLAEIDFWAAYTISHGLRPGSILALAAGNGNVLAASPTGVDALDSSKPNGSMPVAQIHSVSPLTISQGTTLTLNGVGQDGDENGHRIIAWNWMSNRDGPLCTESTCTLPDDIFSTGMHNLSLRVLDDEGMWSLADEVMINVERVWQIFIPITLRE